MTVFKRGIGLAMAVLAFALAASAGAQENLDSGKTGAQLFASNCAPCHKSAQALNKSAGLFGLSGFLREHYTASRESADMIATYIQSFGIAPASAKRTGAARRTPKGDEKAKTTGPKPPEPKTSEPKTPEPKTSEPKTEPKSESKTSEPKSGEAKPAETKASEPKPDAPPAAKSDRPEKPD